VSGLHSAEDVRRGFDEHDYLADQGTSTAVFLALELGLPLLLEGEPGVGKTAAAKVLAATLGVPLIRLQCYEGLSASEALFDWNYQRQLLAIRLADRPS
jgi:MoxR-like ATPase